MAPALSVLLEGFDYDLWANNLWLDAAQTMPAPARPTEVLTHVAWAGEIWLSRVVGVEFHPSERPLVERFQTLNQGWKERLSKDKLERIIRYRNTSGVPYEGQVAAIAWHVINHGTYHRGQLRGLAEGQGFSGFPETDLYGFFIVHEMHQVQHIQEGA
jgi:uncharacterized damage-inducible protein DinB